MPELLLPARGRYGLRDYEKLFCAHPMESQNIFAMRGIDQARGCLVIVRPDQYVSHVLPLDATAEISGFFDAIMLGPS